MEKELKEIVILLSGLFVSSIVAIVFMDRAKINTQGDKIDRLEYQLKDLNATLEAVATGRPKMQYKLKEQENYLY